MLREYSIPSRRVRSPQSMGFRPGAMAVLSSCGDGRGNSLYPKNLFRRQRVMGSAPQSNIIDGRSAVERIRDTMIELEEMSTLAALAIRVHVAALSGVAFPDLPTHPRRNATRLMRLGFHVCIKCYLRVTGRSGVHCVRQ